MSYSIGIDYGTASGRVILVDTSMAILFQVMKKHILTVLLLNHYTETLPRNYFYKMLMIISTYLKMGYACIRRKSSE